MPRNGTVRVGNATGHSTICGVQVGYEAPYTKQIPPGQFAEIKVADSKRQEPVKMEICGETGYLTQNVEFSQGAKHFVVLYDGTQAPAVQPPPQYQFYALRSDYDPTALKNLPTWQNEAGVEKDWVFFSLRSKCPRHMEYKYEPSSAAPQSIDPSKPTGHRFDVDDNDFVEVSTSASEGPISIWIRDTESNGDWIKAVVMPPGIAARLEIAEDCMSIRQRTDSDRFHGCYEYAYSPACGDRREPVNVPEGCADGTPSVEGDMSRDCRFETPKGTCIMRFSASAAGCDVRPE